MELLLSSDPSISIDNESTLDLYGQNVDSVTLKRLSWGLFEVVSSRSFRKNKEAIKVALIGERYEDETALYLADRNKPLSLAGKTEIKGKCYIPEKGVKRAYIEGTTYLGDKLLYGSSQKSEKTLPALSDEIKLAMRKRIGDAVLNLDSMVAFEITEDSITQSFTEKTKLAYSSSIIVMDNKHCSGNVVIKSSKGIVVGAGSTLENTLLYAPFIMIEDGFTGALQAFASDSILIGKNVDLEYPSSFGLLQSGSGEKKSFVKVDEGSVIDGGIICFQENYNYRNPIRIQLEQSSVVQGLVYVNGLVELKGSIFGSLYCNRFSLKTPSTVYENHLLNAVIDVNQRSEWYVGPKLMGKNKGKKEVIQWLN